MTVASLLARFSRTPHKLAIGCFLAWTALWTAIFHNMVQLSEDGLFAGHPYVWADWSMHTGLVSSFAHRLPFHWFSSHPFYAGEQLTYPFVINLLSGLLMRLGLPLDFSMILPSLVLSLVLFWALYYYYKKTGLSGKASLLSIVLFLCSGGIGLAVIVLSQSNILAPGVFATQLSTARIEFTNIAMGMLIPQRAFLLGLPIGLSILSVLYTFSVGKVNHYSHRFLVGLGILAGFLPLMHTHTYLVVVFLSAWLFQFSVKKWKQWFSFGSSAGITSILIYALFLRSSLSPSSFFSLNPGWYVDTGITDWLIFWMKNWGVFGGLALIGTIQSFRLRKRESTVYLGFWMVFIIANIVQFQPQSWDNSKFFAWVYVGLAGVSTLPLRQLWQTRHLVARIFVFVLITSAVASGAFDVLRMIDKQDSTYQMLSSKDIQLGRYIATSTPDQAVILTAETVANPVPMIGGRSVLLGYAGWVFSYGFPLSERQADIKSMYTLTDADALLSKYDISYVLYGDNEQKLGSDIFAGNPKFVPVYRNQNTVLYKRL